MLGNLDKTEIAVMMKIRKKVMTLRMEQEEAVGTQQGRVVNKGGSGRPCWKPG